MITPGRASRSSHSRPSGGRTRSPRTTARGALVITQVGLSVVLLMATGLMIRTVTALAGVRPGFDPAGALTFTVERKDA